MLPLFHDWLCQEPDGQVRIDGPKPRAILSGSFNPLHQGHRLLAEIASRKLGVRVAFELSILNVDKPELSSTEVSRRLGQFLEYATVYVTRAMSFERKSELFPGAIMVVGIDTAERLLAPRYYAGELSKRDQSLGMIRERGTRFLVAGRVDGTGTYRQLEGIAIPELFREMFTAIPEQEFRVDVSSTLLRGRGG